MSDIETFVRFKLHYAFEAALDALRQVEKEFMMHQLERTTTSDGTKLFPMLQWHIDELRGGLEASFIDPVTGKDHICDDGRVLVYEDFTRRAVEKPCARCINQRRDRNG